MAEYGRVGASDYMNGLALQMKTSAENNVFPYMNTTNALPSEFDVDIEITFDVRVGIPFGYVLTFPTLMDNFFHEAGLTVKEGARYTGLSAGYRTAEEARRFAETEVKNVTDRFKKYLDGKKQITKYKYKVQL